MMASDRLWFLVMTATFGVVGCSSTRKKAAGAVVTSTNTEPDESPSSTASAVPEPAMSAAPLPGAAPSPGGAPSPGEVPSAATTAALASPNEIFAAKIALLDRIDDALMRGEPDELAALAVPDAALAKCGHVARDAMPAKITISKDCAVAAATLSRAAINVGSRAELLDQACGMSSLERSELFYRRGGHTFKVTVQTVCVGKEGHLRAIRCHRSEKPTKDVSVSSCTGKWPLVTQTREFPKCPWSTP